mmetsp:Transcript_49830/g.115711  ORF Transcript_49830/g.115711 Transcript_49830/m.115711 type:complete len:260 (-) Transcript_49830:164-943(-)
MDGCHCKIGVAHLLRQPVHLLLGIAEDYGLRDRQCVVEVTECVELPLLAFHCHEELLDAFEGQFVALHQHAKRRAHELVRHLQDFVGHGGRYQHHLSGWRQVPVNVVNLLLEPSVQHLICLVQHQHLDLARAEMPLLDHVEDTARSPRHNVDAGLKCVDVIRDTLPTDAAMNLHIQVVTQSQTHFLTLLCKLARWRQEENLRLAFACNDCLQRTETEDASLSCAALSLDYHVPAFDNRQDGTLLHSRWSLEAVGVNTTQ